MALVLLVEDEKLLRWSLKQRLEKDGHQVHAAEDLAEATSHINKHRPDLLLLDLGLPDGHGLDFFEQNRSILEETVVLVMTAVGQVEDAVRAMKLGALDFLSKPIDHMALVELVNRSIEVRTTKRDAGLARRFQERQLKEEVIAESEEFRRTLEIATEVSRSQVQPILLLGESGTGKNVVARHIHRVSERRNQPFLEVNCAAIPEQLMESELFGHEKGAFTDAKSSRKGSFELAEGGTVLLDEVGEIRYDLQAKLLHLLEDRTFRRVGGARELRADVTVVAATNRDLRRMVAQKEFRDDLYYRLSVFPIEIPALRDRKDDILPLARMFLKNLKKKTGRVFDCLTREAENVLLSYSWPGNIRELRNVMERAVILERGPHLEARSLVLDCIQTVISPEEALGSPAPAEMPQGIVPLEEVEREMVKRAMDAAGDNQTRAAELLGVSRDQLRYRLKKFEE
ncbi:MAG: sigma-54 dependent transcriptional regulator [Thermoanaerobaculales bacterium]|nr:sigma-54 dependent transcriptional regulator [Thermoanaerobaculales bacterium]